jgi:hypothetical protein
MTICLFKQKNKPLFLQKSLNKGFLLTLKIKNMSLLKSEKTVLMINEYTKLKFVFVDKNNEIIEDESYFKNEQVEELLNLMANLYKNNILPVKGDILDIGDGYMEVMKRYFEIKDNIVFIVFDIY